MKNMLLNMLEGKGSLNLFLSCVLSVPSLSWTFRKLLNTLYLHLVLEQEFLYAGVKDIDAIGHLSSCFCV